MSVTVGPSSSCERPAAHSRFPGPGLHRVAALAVFGALLLACQGGSASPGARGSGGRTGGTGERAPAADDGARGVLRGRVRTENGTTFEVEVVQSDALRQRGLQRRSSLARDEGMLFMFPSPGVHRFWMYDCLIPLDIIWLDAGGRVIHIEERLPICRALPCPDYGPASDSLNVLELGAGVALESEIRVGRRLEILLAEPPNPR